MIGTVLSGYQVIDKIKDGSVGTVWKGRNPFNEDVAIKVLSAHHANASKKIKDFRNEAKIITQLKHPGIIKIIKFVDVSPQPYVIMEYFNSENLKFALLNMPDRIRGKEFRILKDIAEALHAMHQQGVVHLDVKPENVLISATSGIRLIDFSIAQSSWGRMFKFGKANWGGTPAYMAPEQIRGEAISPATDQYAFGILAYELFAKRTPFLASTQNALLEKHLSEPVPPLKKLLPKTPPDVDRVLLRMLEKDPAARWPDMAAVIYELGKLSEKWGVWWVDMTGNTTNRMSAHTARLATPTTPPTSSIPVRPPVHPEDLSFHKTHPMPVAKEFRAKETDTLKAAAPASPAPPQKKAVPPAAAASTAGAQERKPTGRMPATEPKPTPAPGASTTQAKTGKSSSPRVAAVVPSDAKAGKASSPRVAAVPAPEAKAELPPPASLPVPAPGGDAAARFATASGDELKLVESTTPAPAAPVPVPPQEPVASVPEPASGPAPVTGTPAPSEAALSHQVDEVEALLQQRLQRRLDDERKRKQKVAEEGAPSEPLPRNAPHESDMNLPAVR
jgi:serine/threonine-protein kinase